MDFNEIKAEILTRAKKASACKDQYERACRSESIGELCEAIKDNFFWCCNSRVIDAQLIGDNANLFAEQDVYANVSVTTGFLLASENATVRASGNATVEASENATVRASENATVRAWGNATVRAWGNATVEAWGNATVRAWGNATVRAWGNATVRASGNATVEASENAYVNCHTSIECSLEGNAIVRRWDSNTIEYVNSDIKFNLLKS